MAFNPNMSNKEVADLILLNYKDKTPFLNLDYANVTTTNLDATRDFATGGQGAPNRVAFDGQRNGTLTVQTQIATMKLFSLISGTDIEDSFEYIKRLTLTASDGKLTIPDDVNLASGSIYVYAASDDCGTQLQVTTEDKTITLPENTTETDFVVYGTVKVESGAQVVKFNSKDFPKAFTIYGDTPWKTEDDEIVDMHLAYYKAVPQSSMELAFDNSSVISMTITCDLLADDENRIYDMAIVE
jgi:hypothetical protein